MSVFLCISCDSVLFVLLELKFLDVKTESLLGGNLPGSWTAMELPSQSESVAHSVQCSSSFVSLFLNTCPL